MTAFERNRYAPGAKEYFRIWGGNIQLIGKSYRLEMEVNLVRAAHCGDANPCLVLRFQYSLQRTSGCKFL
jgi:hypothetical protein